MSDATDRQLAEGAVTALGAALGFPMPAALVVGLAEMAVARVSGLAWTEAVAAGQLAAAQIITEADAERSRRERLGET
jgi:hypothetical protein